MIVFPLAPKKGMVRFSKKGTFNAWRHAMRALLSALQRAKRALQMNLFIYIQSKSLIANNSSLYASCRFVGWDSYISLILNNYQKLYMYMMTVDNPNFS